MAPFIRSSRIALLIAALAGLSACQEPTQETGLVMESAPVVEPVAAKTNDEIEAELKKIIMLPWFRGLHQRGIKTVDLNELNTPSSAQLPEMVDVLDAYQDTNNASVASKATKAAYYDMNREYAFVLLIKYFDEGPVSQHSLRVDFTSDAEGLVSPIRAGEYWRCRDSATGEDVVSGAPCPN